MSHDRKRQEDTSDDGSLNGLAVRIDERELVRRARHGDERALRGLYDAHVDRVFRLAYRMSGDEEVARDATQAAFVRAFQRLERAFRPNTFVDISRTLEAKIAALRCYESEIRPFPHPRSPEAIEAIARRWGSVAGFRAAEAFELIRAIRPGKGHP